MVSFVSDFAILGFPDSFDGFIVGEDWILLGHLMFQIVQLWIRGPFDVLMFQILLGRLMVLDFDLYIFSNFSLNNFCN